MMKKAAVILGILFLLTGAVFLYFRLQREPMQQLEYSDGGEILENPGQGWYLQCPVGDRERIPSIAQENPNLRLLLLTLDLKDYWELDELPQERLLKLEESLKLAQESGLSIVFRAAYDFSGNCPEVPLERILGHIRQIAPILNRYSGIVTEVQAGFLGAWGEWHGVAYTEKTPQARQARLQVIRTLADSLDPAIPVALRRPRYLREAIEDGIPAARLGFHNDGLFGSDSDLGTYDDGDYSRSEELEWLEKTLASSFGGGEMPYVTEFAEGGNAIMELEQMNAGYLNGYADQSVIELWKSTQYEGTTVYDYITGHLGYRLGLDWVRVSRKPKNGKFSLEARVANSGFAPFSRPYQAYLMVETDKKVQQIPVELAMEDEDTGRLLAEDIPIEGIDEAQQVRVGLKLTVLPQDPGREEYCVELANSETVYEDGCNWMFTYRRNENGSFDLGLLDG